MLKPCEFNLEELVELLSTSEDYTMFGLNQCVNEGNYTSIKNNARYGTLKSSEDGIGFLLIHLKDGYAMLPYAFDTYGDGWERLMPETFRYLIPEDAEMLIAVQKKCMEKILHINDVYESMRLPLLFKQCSPEEIKEKRGF
jgi:hypothetical protein